MNKLQKKAWIGLVSTTVFVVLAGIGVGLTVHLNAKGIVALMSFLIAGLVAGLLSYLRNIRVQAEFDERERKIVYKAFAISSYTFILFYCLASFIIFYIVGAKNSIPAYTLPVLLIIAIFLFQFVQSAVILIQFTREQIDEQ